MSTIGYINSIQTFGAVDGPGVRFVVFLQGCNLRCGYCHNPETWEIGIGQQMTAEELVDRVVRYKNYFGEKGGITITGGEPLLQAEFVYNVFKLCKSEGINTCLDTSGSIFNSTVELLLTMTDKVLLDYKFITDDQYRRHSGCSIRAPLKF